MYIQNKIYLTKFEDSSKNDIYIREMKGKIGPENTVGTSIPVNITYEDNTSSTIYFNKYIGNTFSRSSSYEHNIAKCSEIWSKGSIYYAVGCPK